MTQTRRERQRDATRSEIINTAWKQIGEIGAVALSLRGIAREMGMTAPALYYYFRDRDALVTALLIEAFDSFSAALQAGRDSDAQDDHAGRFRAMCRAYFRWAATNPQRYTLLFGTPIEGYMFAAEVGPAAQRSFLVLQGVIGEAHAAGKLGGNFAGLVLPDELMAQYQVLRQFGMPYEERVTHLALFAWSMIHGITSLYLYNYLGAFLANNVESFVDSQVETMIRIIGIE